MKRASSLVLLGLLALLPKGASAQAVGASLGPMHAKLIERFGPTALRTESRPGSQLLTVSLSDVRYRRAGVSFTDTAAVVAAYASSLLPTGFRPDSIKVEILLTDVKTGVERHKSSSSMTFAAKHTP